MRTVKVQTNNWLIPTCAWLKNVAQLRQIFM